MSTLNERLEAAYEVAEAAREEVHRLQLEAVQNNDGSVAELYVQMIKAETAEFKPKEPVLGIQTKAFVLTPDDHYEDRANQVGKFVAIRPASEEKTYLGLYLGSLPRSIGVRHNPDTQITGLRFSFYNPAIFVFDLKKIVYGMESWWGVIKSPEDLKAITDQDINDVWYVKALNQMSSTNGKEASKDQDKQA